MLLALHKEFFNRKPGCVTMPNYVGKIQSSV